MFQLNMIESTGRSSRARHGGPVGRAQPTQRSILKLPSLLIASIFLCGVTLRQRLVRPFAGRFPKSDPNIFASSIRFPNALRMSGPQRLQQASIQSSKQHHEIWASQAQILQGKIAGSSKMPLRGENNSVRSGRIESEQVHRTRKIILHCRP